MLIMPTADLVGIITDVLPLAPDPKDKDNPRGGVLLEWDGEALHAHATDGLSAGISTYHPDDPTDFDDDATQPVVYWGDSGGDPEPRWRVFITTADAKEVVSTFKLAYKFRMVPLHVKVNLARTRLIIERTRDTGKTQHEMTVERVADADRVFPDLRAQIDRAEGNTASVDRLAVWGHRLAAFANAGRRGPVELIPVRFADDELVVVRVGSRFAGYVTPHTEPRRPPSDVLRNGAGVLVGGPS